MPESNGNGKVAVEDLSTPPGLPASEFTEVKLTPTQLDIINTLSIQVAASMEAAEAAAGVARTKQAALDQAVNMILGLAGVDQNGCNVMLDKQRLVIKLVPQGNTIHAS